MAFYYFCNIILTKNRKIVLIFRKRILLALLGEKDAVQFFVFILLFLPTTVLAYYLANRIKPAIGKVVIIVASVIFYSCSNWKLSSILGISLIINLGFSMLIQKFRQFSKPLFIAPVVINVGMLLFFKYTNFFITAVNQHSCMECSTLDLIQPVGISFLHFNKLLIWWHYINKR